MLVVAVAIALGAVPAIVWIRTRRVYVREHVARLPSVACAACGTLYGNRAVVDAFDRVMRASENAKVSWFGGDPAFHRVAVTCAACGAAEQFDLRQRPIRARSA